jgi:hypothetical protein
MEEHRREQEEAEAAKQQKEHEKILRIARVEAQMAINKNDVTPRVPRHQLPRVRLQRTECVANFEDEEVEATADADTPMGQNRDFDRASSVPKSVPGESATDTDEEAPPKKKVKPTFRGKIKAATEEMYRNGMIGIAAESDDHHDPALVTPKPKPKPKPIRKQQMFVHSISHTVSFDSFSMLSLDNAALPFIFAH